MRNYQDIENPIHSKIKSRGLLRKCSLNPTTLKQLHNSLAATLQRCPCRNSVLSEQVLRGIEINAQLSSYLGTLEEELQQITVQLAQLERNYRFVENIGHQECESFDISYLEEEREQKTTLLLSRLNNILSLSRSYGSKELLKTPIQTHPFQEQRSLRPPPLSFHHDY